jgi:hypothetical protein
LTGVLQEAIRRQCVGSEFRGGFPHLVWGRYQDELYEAQLTNQGNGAYHGYPVLDAPRPRDPLNKLHVEA